MRPYKGLERGLWLVLCLLVSCTAVNPTTKTAPPEPGASDEKETMMPDVPETPESETPHPKEPGSDETPALTPREGITVTSDVVIPSYEPLDVPYSEWEAYRSQELLAANGFGDTRDEWRRAAGHSSGLIRSAATYLLSREPEPQDEALFRVGLEDTDQNVQSLAAYGLYKLGDESVVPTLETIAGLDVNVYTAAPRAAGILGEIGEPAAFATIEAAMDSELVYVRLFAIENAPPFVPLHGETYAPGKTIDIWALYRRALQDESSQVSSVARMELEELDSPEARRLLGDAATPTP
jgi:hypothetical protein